MSLNTFETLSVHGLWKNILYDLDLELEKSKKMIDCAIK